MSDEDVSTFEQTHVLERSWLIPGLAFLAFVVGLPLLATESLEGKCLGAMMVWVGGWTSLLTVLRNAFPKARRVGLTATPRALRLDGEEIPVEEIAEAKTTERSVVAEEVVVELVCKGRRIALSLPPDGAKLLLEVIGARAGERRATFTRILPFRTRFLWTCALAGAPWLLFLVAAVGADSFPAFFSAFVGLLPVCAAIATLAGVIRGKVVIGAEGFTTSWYGVRRVHRFADVETILEQPKGLGVVETIVRFRSRRAFSISILDAPDTHAQRGAETRAFAAMMEQAFRRWRHAPAVAELSAHLRRGQRSGEAWLAGIDQLIRGGGQQYRIAALTPELLADVAKNTEATTETRVGAATALLRLGAEEHRVTVRVAAEACAEPKTRAALLELVDAQDDEHKLERVLGRVR